VPVSLDCLYGDGLVRLSRINLDSSAIELHQMDVKTVLLNSDLNETISWHSRKALLWKGKEQMGCKLKKSNYGLKQMSRQWNIKFNQ
jgi:hypothetical protein